MSDDARQSPGFRVRIAYADGTVIEDSADFLSWTGGGELVDEGQATGPSTLRKVSGQRKYNNIVLKRGADTSRNVYQWWVKVEREGADGLADGVIETLDHTGTTIHTYAFKQGWPIKWSVSELTSAPGSAHEEITIQFKSVAIE